MYFAMAEGIVLSVEIKNNVMMMIQSVLRACKLLIHNNIFSITIETS